MTVARSILVGTLFSALASVGCSSASSRERQFDGAQRRLHASFVTRVDDLTVAHREGKNVAHLQQAVRALQVVNLTSIRALLPEVDYLAEQVAKNGVRPYLTLVIDLSYRLGRIKRPETQRGFVRLAQAVLNAKDATPARIDARAMALIRVRGGLRYRQYDENTAHAVATMIASEFGRGQVKRGQSPIDILRTTAMLWECQPNTARDSLRGERAKQSCKDFIDLVAAQLNEKGQGDILSGAMADLRGGTMVRSLACFEGSDLGSKMIAEFEDFTACMANQGQSGNPVAKVANGAAVTTEWTGSHPDYPGYQHVKSTQTVYSNTNGDEGTQVSHEYTSSEGMSVTVSEFTTTVNGVQSSGSSIQTNDGKGNTYYEVQNESGDVVFSFEEQSNGTVETYEKHQDGGATSVTTDGNGESDVTHTDSQGNVTTAHIKENGECEGTACSLSMPPDDYSATSNCSLHGNPIDDADEKLTADPLGPYIYPAEGSGSASDPLLACVVASMASLTPKRCPPSVALCIEPPPPGSCGCAGGATGAGGATPPAKSGQCAKMMCAEGSCNPETGTCGSGGTMPDGSPGGLCPGIIPPRPQIDIGKFHLMSPGARIPRGR